MRIESKKTDEKMAQIESQLYIAKPEHAHEPNIPASVSNPQGLSYPTQKELEVEAGGAGQYDVNTNEEKILADPSWKDDVIPEIIEGRNIADYIDPNIEEKFNALIEEEKVRYQEYLREKSAFEDVKWRLTPEQEEMNRIIEERRQLIRNKAQEKRTSRVGMPEKFKKKSEAAMAERVDELLAARGIDAETRQRAVEKVMSTKPTRVERKITPKSHSKGEAKRGPGVKYDYYVKSNYILEPKFMFSGKTGFKRDYK